MKQFNLILYLSLTIAGSVGPIHPTHGLLQKDGNQNHLKVHLISCKMSEMEKKGLRFQVKTLLSVFQMRKPKPMKVSCQSAQKLPLTLDFYYLVSILSHCQRENVKTFGLILKLKLKINSLLTS